MFVSLFSSSSKRINFCIWVFCGGLKKATSSLRYPFFFSYLGCLELGAKKMTLEKIRGENENYDNFPVGLRVLAVDDDPVCLKILDAMLRKCQYHVTTTNQARTALKMLRENKDRFDLVISDVHMPDMDGFKLLELVGLEMDLPVIMLSANSDPKNVRKGVNHGACDYLVKPVQIEELRNIWQHVPRRKKSDSKSQSNKSGDQVSSRKVSGEGHTSPMKVGGYQNGKFNRKRKEEEDETEDNGNESEDPSSQKKPRVVWSIEPHRKFVAAVNQLGIEKAVPKRILELMNVEGLTRKNVASHLQEVSQPAWLQFGQPNMFPVKFQMVQYGQQEHQQSNNQQGSEMDHVTSAVVEGYQSTTPVANLEKEAEETSRRIEKGKTRTGLRVTLEDLERQFGKSREDAAKNLSVSISTFKRACRFHSIHRWPSGKMQRKNPSLYMTNHANAFDGDPQGTAGPSSSSLRLPVGENVPRTNAESNQDLTIVPETDLVIIKAKYEDEIVKFQFCLSSGLVNLAKEVATRLNLEMGRFKLKYVDEDNDHILLTCDADFQLYVKSLKAAGKNCIPVFVKLMG